MFELTLEGLLGILFFPKLEGSLRGDLTCLEERARDFGFIIALLLLLLYFSYEMGALN